jgi:hypothetical protein
MSPPTTSTPVEGLPSGRLALKDSPEPTPAGGLGTAATGATHDQPLALR